MTALRELFRSDPVLALALMAALVAIATTPLAFAVLGRMGWFEARRGRTTLKPSFWSVVCSMILVMAIPAIFAVLALKSRYYDADRYEFDPNQTISVLDQGRQYRTLREADEAVRDERKRLEEERRRLLDSVKALDETLITMRAAAVQHPATYEALPPLLDTLAAVHKAVGLDAPQQLFDETAPPEGVPAGPPSVVMMAAMPAGGTLATPTAAAPPTNGLSDAVRAAELAAVPAPQRTLAGYLPLTNPPAGWVIGKSGNAHIESFNAENLYEKINGRAESFIQYAVKGMAYAYYHPRGDDSSEAQLYIYEMGDPLKAFGKYSSEKPEGVTPAELGDEGYAASGSVFFYLGPYYVQITTTSDAPEVADFAQALARQVANAMRPGSAPEPSAASESIAATESNTPTQPPPVAVAASPALYFKSLPAGPGRSGEKYVTQDVFGYSFLTDVFLADYRDGDLFWQGFVRPYETPEAASQMFETYMAAVKDFGATVEEVDIEGASRMAVSNLDGLVDVVFLKGNTLAGANGSTDRPAAESFARAFAQALPGEMPALPPSPSEPGAAESGGEGY